MLETPFTFKKGERLKKKQHLDVLFQSKNSFIIYPLRVIYAPIDRDLDNPTPIKVLVSVPKRRIKMAVQRNLLKRRIREAYRLQKGELYSIIDKSDLQYAVGFLYVANDIKTYEVISTAVKTAVAELKNKL